VEKTPTCDPLPANRGFKFDPSKATFPDKGKSDYMNALRNAGLIE
jgi:hypothetical protein